LTDFFGIESLSLLFRIEGHVIERLSSFLNENLKSFDDFFLWVAGRLCERRDVVLSEEVHESWVEDV
jgi:hypothetical protein